MEKWLHDFKRLTEHAYVTNKNVGVTYIAHSLGGRMLLYFLQKMSQEWKDKYVKRVIALSVPWGGSILAIQAMSVGHNPFLFRPTKKIMELHRTFSSLAWLVPTDEFWNSTEGIVTLDGQNYTIDDIASVFL